MWYNSAITFVEVSGGLMKRTNVLLSLLTLFLVLALAACGGGGGNTDDQPEPAGTAFLELVVGTPSGEEPAIQLVRVTPDPELTPFIELIVGTPESDPAIRLVPVGTPSP